MRVVSFTVEYEHFKPFKDVLIDGQDFNFEQVFLSPKGQILVVR